MSIWRPAGTVRREHWGATGVPRRHGVGWASPGRADWTGTDKRQGRALSRPGGRAAATNRLGRPRPRRRDSSRRIRSLSAGSARELACRSIGPTLSARAPREGKGSARWYRAAGAIGQRSSAIPRDGPCKVIRSRPSSPPWKRRGSTRRSRSRIGWAPASWCPSAASGMGQPSGAGAPGSGSTDALTAAFGSAPLASGDCGLPSRTAVPARAARPESQRAAVHPNREIEAYGE